MAKFKSVKWLKPTYPFEAHQQLKLLVKLSSPKLTDEPSLKLLKLYLTFPDLT